MQTPAPESRIEYDFAPGVDIRPLPDTEGTAESDETSR
jgi:hypothetical protein